MKLNDVALTCLAFDLVTVNRKKAAQDLIHAAEMRGYITEAQAKHIQKEIRKHSASRKEWKELHRGWKHG